MPKTIPNATIIPVGDARPGDIIVCKRRGILAAILSWLIRRFREPNWDRWGWHMMPVVAPDYVLDAQFPKLKYNLLSDYTDRGRELRVYRIFSTLPIPEIVAEFADDYVGCKYDFLVYLWTALDHFFGFPRLSDRFFNCWEATFCLAEDLGIHIVPRHRYPFITDFLRAVGELDG